MMKPALLVIDLQRWFLEVGPPEKRARAETLLANTNALLAFFRQRGLPVIRVQTVHTADGSTWNQWMKEHNSPRLIDGTREAEEHPDLQVDDSHVVNRKTRHSAFLRTGLERILREHGTDSLVIAGFSTNACVGLTTIDAYERDFRILLAGDAILGTNQEQGRLMLEYLRDRFAIEPMTNASIMERVAGQVTAGAGADA